MNILIVKQLFYPEPTAKSLDFALELKKRGHNVTVLTSFPSYPLGRIYPDYRQKIKSIQQIDGINVIRVPIYPNHSRNGGKRILNYLSYAISASLIGAPLIKRADVAFIYQGAITVGIPAILFKLLFGIEFVYDINDLWPETLGASGMLKNHALLNFVEQWCLLNYSQASKITVCTPGFKKALIKKGIPASKIEIVSNWSRDEVDQEGLIDTDQVFRSDRLNILYAGNLGLAQSLDVLIHAAAELTKLGENKVQFIVMGDGVDKSRLIQLADMLKLRNVKFLPRVDSWEVKKYLQSADLLFVHLKKSELFEITIPSKILSYLRVGKPILLGLSGDAANLIDESGGGLVFEPENHIELVKCIKQYQDMEKLEKVKIGNRGRLFYEEYLTIEKSVNKIEAILRSV
jgi:colanic acid biosynthesis glycosyl transferase WcaI